MTLEDLHEQYADEWHVWTSGRGELFLATRLDDLTTNQEQIPGITRTLVEHSVEALSYALEDQIRLTSEPATP